MTINGENLNLALVEALKSCEQSSLTRARKMMFSLDIDILMLVATHEHDKTLAMPMPANTMGQLLTSARHTASLRRLIDIGAIKVTDSTNIGYCWTSDGKQMIKELNKVHPRLLPTIRSPDFNQ